MNTHKTFNLMIAIVFTFSLFMIPTPVSAQEYPPIISSPFIRVLMSGHRIEARQWPVGTEVTMTIHDPANGEETNNDIKETAVVLAEDPNGDGVDVAFFTWPATGLQPGFVVTMSGNGTSKTLVVSALKITIINPIANTVSGIATPGNWVEVDCACAAGPATTRWVTANTETGEWTANFSVPDLPPYDGTVDFQPHMLFIVDEFDSDGDQTIVSGEPYNPNTSPIIWNITVPVDPRQVGTIVDATAYFWDPDLFDTHTATWDWGDGSQANGIVDEGSQTVFGSHVYTNAGVYTVTATVTDVVGAFSTFSSGYLVIYDPGAGFVTGGGWINSPAGAYSPDPSLTGKATFGFVSKYQKGKNIPTGNTEFQFKIGNLKFSSTAYDWLVIAGAKAQYKGTGTINGSGSYRFMLTAIDGKANGGGGVDKFRIKIWDLVSGNMIYDNQNGAADDALPTTALQGGSIVIHK
jgi:hypothetical protein